MKLKDLFNSTKTIQSSSLEDMANEVESQEYIESFNKDKVRFMPNVDYSDPKNFAFFGSAERYYTDGFKRIRNTYPYDGSEKEKYDWLFDSTFIDMYLFEHKYPRFNGYATLSYPSWGTLNGSIIDGYGKSTTNTYIKTFGGPNKSDLLGLKKQYEDANILDADKSRESNLKFDLSEGVTIEMWVKKPAFDTSKTEKEVLFDLWNGEASSSAQYGRLRLELTGASSGSPFLFTALSGTSGVQNQSIGQDLTTGSIEDWTHVALSLKNSGNDISANLYINGQFNQEQTVSSAAIENVTGSIISYIGALQTAPSGSPTVIEGAGKFSGSIDEFRYWKTERTSKQIGRYYWTNIGGGTNSDEANTKLGVYYKFNEGVTQTASIDSRVLDYSGRVSNGSWFGYQDGARSEDSAIVLAGASPKEFKDPTIYSTHPDYISALSELQASGSIHDINNNASLIKSVPGWILEEDKEEGNVNILTHIMASYYDNLYLHIQDLNSLKDVYAHFQTKITDRHNNTDTEGSVKPLPFADRLLTNAGFVAPELFADASVIEALATRSEDEHYEMKLHDVKNQIYQNVYSSLVNIYKEKGTNKAFRNVLHAFGIDEDVVKINFYGDNVDFEINDRYNIRASKEKFVDFNHPDRFAGTIYQYASGTDGVSFISGSGGDFEKYIPVTVETQVILPNKLDWMSAEGFQTPFTKSVILGMHEADPSDGTDYTIPLSDYSEIQMYTVRDREESRRVRFHLSSSVLGVHLSSSLYDDMYLNNEWLLSFRLRNEKFPTTDFVASSSLNADYIIDFIGLNTDGNSTINSFEFSSSVAAADAHNFLNSSKRLYAGAKRTNFTGSLLESSDHKIGFVRYWMNYLDNETLKHHSYDSNNIGAKSPMRSAYLMEDSINDIKVPEIDTLLLNWDFKTLSKSDANGQFISIDVTSGSGEQRYVQAFEDVKRKFYHGRGDNFLANDEKVIDVEYINAARSTYPEILQGDDMIEIRTQDDSQFTKETLPQDYYIAFEKSMAQTVSEEMIRFMSSVKDFNNLIGRPVDKYRQEYKDLTNLRQLFFERVSNEPDLDKYIDYYKWLDDSLGEMLVALVPASLVHSDGINNVIENYVFSRDKYDHKFPTIEFKAPTPEGGMNTINRHLYPWKQGHAPTSGNEDENCYWHLERKEKDEPRTKIFQARNSVLNRSFTTAQHFAVDRSRAIHGGTNYEDNKKRDYIWSATKEVSESPLTYGEYGGFPLRYVLTNNDMFQSLKDCSDERPVTEKIKRAFSAVEGFTAFHHHQSGGIDGVYKGGMVFPFNIMSSSVTTGYTSQVNGIPGLLENVDVVNIHSDTTDNTNEIPMQSPFAERWVGGHQHRHAPINDGNDSMQTRGEGYKILINNIENQSGSIGIVGADYPHPYASQYDAPFFNVEQAKARYYREERAKRPVNIKNIETTGSQVGNYQKKYQFVHTFGRTQNKTFFRGVDLDENIHNQINSSMPATNLETSLVARGTTGEGNLASNFDSSNLYLGGIKDSNPTTSGSTPSKHTIASRFSAPGGFETMSEVFLDLSAKEHSAYNSLPFRNLQVRGSGSGEEGSILHLEDIHGNRYGLMSHLTRHSSWGGVDSVVGNNKPSFHKVNRNPKWDASEEEKDYDNYWVQHQIPQSDFQYQWVKQSHTASYATSSLAGHVLSGFTEPSGTTSRYPHEHIDNTVVSQSVINQRIDGITAYGFPSWDQIRNNDKNTNIQLKKAYGYNINSGNVEESRVTENIPNSADVKFRDSEFQFKYPYVNMKYHFDNIKLRFETDKTKNETLYKSIYGYYSQNTNDVEVLKKNIKQIIFPRYVKHTKYSTRHRHFFASKFWAKGENDLYNSDISETGSYYRLDEQGRRETNVTASLFAEGSLNSKIKEMMDLGHLTNIIPSQSIWNMDSRTNFTSSNPQTAATDSDGAPGVLQNQDHHFHNGLKTLLVTGSAATGSFVTKGATVFGTPSSGSFTVHGMIPTGISASGSFEITGANVQGTQATGEFTVEPSYLDAVSSSFRFTADEMTVFGTESTASFEVSGAIVEGTSATSTFTVSGLPAGGERSYLQFDASYQMAKDGFAIYANSGSIRGIEVDYLLPSSVVGTNISVSPITYKKAIELQDDEYLSGSVSIESDDITLSFYMIITDASLLNGTYEKYVYTLFSGSTSDPVLEIYFDVSGSGQTQNDLYVRRFGDNGSGGTGYRQHKFTNVGGDSKFRHFVITSQASAGNMQRLYVDGTAHSNVTASYGGGGVSGGLYNTGTMHYVGLDGSKSYWDSKWTISDFIGWDTTPADAGESQDFVDAIYNSGKFSPDTSASGSNIVFHYTFGDDSGDGTRASDNIVDVDNTFGPYPLTLRGNLANSSFTNSKFASMKGATTYFNELSSAFATDTNFSTYFDLAFEEYTEAATAPISTKWFHTSSFDVEPQDSTYITGHIGIGDELNYARFFITAKAESSNVAYDLNPSASNGGTSIDQEKGFRNLDSIDSGSAQVNAMTSIEDTGITINGTTISFDHHANSQGTPKVATFASTYNRCISGSSTTNAVALSNTSYSGKGLSATDDISVSYWHSKVGTSFEGIFFLDATTGNATVGALFIYHGSSTVIIRLSSGSGSTEYKYWSATYTSLGINKEDLNNFCWTIDVSNVSSDSAITLYVNGSSATLSATTGAGFGAYSHTYTKIQVNGADGSALYELTGKLCQVAVWDTILDSADASEIYHDGRIKDLYRHKKSANLMHWYKLGEESSLLALSIGDSLTSITTIPDSTPRGRKVDLTVSYGSLITVENGLPDNIISNSTLWTNLNSSIDSNVASYDADNVNGSFTITATSTGSAANSHTHTEDSPLITSLVSPSAGGTDRVGSFDGDYVIIDTKRFELDIDGTSDTADFKYITINSVTNTQVWDELKAEIDASSSFTVTSTSSIGNVATFNLQAKSTGSSENSAFTVNGASFNLTKDSEGGTDETGAVDGDYIEFFAYAGQYAHGFRVVVDKDNSDTGGLNYSASVNGGTGFTTIYVDSTRASNADFWNSIEAAIESEGFDVAQGVDNPRTFTVTNYITGAAGNGGGSGNGGTSGGTFVKLDSKFLNGSDATGAESGDTITIDGTTFTIIHSGVPTATQVVASGVTDATFWESLRTKIESNTSYTAVTGSDDPRTFNITSTATGSAEDPSITETGTTFTIVDAGTAGTDEAGAEDGDTITIDGSTFAIDLASGLGTGSITNFHNALSQSIIDNTDFDLITIANLGTGYYRFSLTSSVTGTAKNVLFTQNTNGSRATFQNLLGAAGGVSPVGIEDLDYIRIRDEENSRDRYFAVDLNGDEIDDTPTDYVYIDASGYVGTDAQKSTQFWNDLSAAIISNTAYDTVTYTSSSNIATFSITSSITGTAYNNDILSVYSGTDDFTIVSNTSGGTEDSGAKAGDTITIGGVTFTLVTGSVAGAGEIICGINVGYANTITNADFFNNITAAIEASTSVNPVTWTVYNTNSASFSLTSSVTGTVYNALMTETGDTFTNLSGMSGGYDPVYIKFGDIIPTPRYGYPHVLTSPGSLRAPSAKSNLGLIDNDYKLRSNHFSLTRSLGYTTDGLYDNTSRWTTPDLSGLTPMDDDYNVWYERIRGHNKHFSLIPEYRMSSHVEGIIKNGMDEKSYFAKNYWLEITGASLDNGQTVARNNRGESAEFLKEYSSTTNIRDIEDFIEDNVANMDLQPFTLTLTCEALKSFLPYEGFYPQSRTVQMCEAFAGSYGKGITAVEANPNDTELEFPDNNAIAQTRPVFDAVMSPGLLYNTIKSGMAVDYPVVTTKMATASLKDPYGGTNYMISNEFFDNRLPFETLLKPESYMSKEYLVDMNPHPSSSVNLKAKIGEASDPNYKLMSNNFFAEAMEFFLQEGKSSRIVSKPENDPDFGIVIANHAGILPTYRSIFRVYKSKKQHPWVEFEGVSEVIKDKTEDGYYYINESKKDRFYNRPPSGTNYFLSEYQGLTGTDLEYDIEKINYPRPQMNTYAEVETITMYSQPNAFGPPCAGGVAVEYKGRNGVGDAITGGRNNTTYMMYDSTNGYNAPFTPPYYDGEAWAIYTFTPQKSGKHTLNEILQNTTVEYLRYELNHESGSYGDRGTFGPQGYTINDNAMQVDASFNLFKQVANGAEGSSWVIESKFETPILDFSKYLNREYNAEFESEVTSEDIYTDKLSLSGSRQEPDTLSTVHSSLSTVHELSGILNPIGMWHQYGEFPQEADRGIFMQMIDMPVEYQQLGTELPIANPKYAVVKPNIASCDGAGLAAAYNDNPRDTMYPYFKKQIIKRRLVGDDEFAVEGGSIQIINPETDIIIDTELRYVDMQNIFGINLTSTASAAENFKMFDVFRDTTYLTMSVLTGSSDFTASTLNVFIDGASSTDYDASTNGNFAGHWAASYYHYDRESSYAPLLITTKNYDSMAYDYGEFSKGFFEDFLADFSIGIPYGEQSTRYGDALEVGCHSGANGTVLVPGYISQIIDKNNNELTIGKLANINMTDASRASLTDLVGARTIAAVATPATMNATAISINNSIRATRANSNTFSAVRKTNRRFKFGLIPDYPAVSALASADTSSYKFPEPMFVRGAIKYNAGAPTASSDVNQRNITYFKEMPQYAPQSDNNIGGNPSTVRWGQFMHSNSDPVRSLAELVGFDKEPVKMGVTAKSRVIKEAVVAVPYITNKDQIPEFLNLNLENGTSQDPEVQRQIQKMKEYVFPPHLDFLNYDVQPVPMYIFEFTKTLERDDLNGLWQGVITEDLKRVEEDSKTITHVLSPNSLLGSLKDVSPNMNILKKVRWRIFKVKQRGNFSYEEKMNKDLGKATKDKDLVGYNWPYDYFSLVENVKLSVDVELRKPIQAQGGTALIPEGGYTGTGIGGDPIATDTFDLEIGREVSINRSDFQENIGQSTYSSQTQSQEDRFTYSDAKNEILREFRKAIRTDLRVGNKKWNDLKIRAKRRYVKRAISSVELTIVYANMVDSFPNIKGFTERLKPSDF